MEALLFWFYMSMLQRKVLWNKSMKNFTLGLGGIVGVYVTVIFLLFMAVKTLDGEICRS